MIVQQGSINTTALIVPDLYVQIVPPSVTLLNGVPTNGLGIVGTATWGPVNAPTVIGDMPSYARLFGAIQARKYDLGTAVAAAVWQGANNMTVVRVTDGTDVAASSVVQTNCMTLASKYTGSLGNQITATLSAGSQVGTYKLVIAMPGVAPEVFDNMGGGLAGNAIWGDMVDDINNGQGGLRGPSQLIVATLGAGTTAPALATLAFTGGTDGATTINGSVLVGVDTVPRKGMYALRSTGVSVGFLADCDDTTQFSAQVAFGLSEGIYMIGTTPMGDTIANAVSTKATAGIDSYAFKYMLGDWVAINDTVNNTQRYISPQGFVAGRLANLSPEQSSLNKPLFGIIGTQRTIQGIPYAEADLQQLGQAGIDVITNPVPGGNYFGVRFGHNSSSSAVINGDNYTRMTNYIASSLNAGMGIFVGKLQTPTTQQQAKATISAFLANMEQQKMIGGVNGAPAYSVVLDGSNNPQSRVALGYMQADVQVTYLSVVEKFLVNLQGGQSVVVTKQ
jgi:phage tail sheath protein FI